MTINRIVVAAGIIVGGVTLASVFPTVPEKVPSPPTTPPYVIRHRPPAQESSAPTHRAPTLSTQAKRQAKKPIASASGQKSPGAPPGAASGVTRPELPVMAKSFPSITPFPDQLERGPARLEATWRREPKMHRIVDGDTLEEIAERYLGDASLADQVFQANRDLLEDPRLLPIGAELTIPDLAAPAH